MTELLRNILKFLRHRTYPHCLLSDRLEKILREVEIPHRRLRGKSAARHVANTIEGEIERLDGRWHLFRRELLDRVAAKRRGSDPESGKNVLLR